MSAISITAASVVPSANAQINKARLAGATVTAGQAVYLDADGKVQPADANGSALLRAIKSAVDNASFDGGNILNGTLTNGLRFLANAGATQFITLSGKNLSLSGAIISLSLTDSLLTVTGSTTALTKLDASINNLNKSLGDVGAQAKQISAHNTFVLKLSDTIESGIGNLVDADMAKESARLQALQVQQQLGAQALSIANQAPQIILSLFQGG